MTSPQRPYPDATREAIAAAVEVEIQRVTRPFRIRQYALYAILVGLIGLAVWNSDRERGKIRAEAKARTDQTCRLFESDHLADVDEYAKEIRGRQNTLRFLRETPESENPGLHRAIVRGLPAQIDDYRRAKREATVDVAPSFCDKPGVGRPEPDPKLPKDPF